MHAPKGGSAKQVEAYWSTSQMLAKLKDRLDMAALVNLRQLGANRLKFGYCPTGRQALGPIF